jgi:ABC-type antimicrobial peptide transport system permease subunit
VSNVFRNALHGLSPHNPAVYASVAILCLIVIATACLLPAMRVLRIDPLKSLQD